MSTATCPRPSTVATRATLAWAAMRRMTDLFTMRFLFLACSVRSPGPVSGRTCPHHFDKTAHQNVRPAPRLTFRRVAFATNELCRGSRTASAGPGTGPGPAFGKPAGQTVTEPAQVWFLKVARAWILSAPGRLAMTFRIVNEPLGPAV